jgi:hypothetical protein
MRSLLAACAVSLLGACAPGSLVGKNCPELGLEECEGNAPLQCDGRRWVQLGECAGRCVMTPGTTHDEAEVTADTTWTCAESGHTVTGTLTIAPNTTLTIEPGTTIRVATGGRIVASPEARVVAEGTNLTPILITSDNETRGGFGGLSEGGLNVYVNKTAEPSVLKNVIVERAIHGLGLFGLEDGEVPPVVEDCTFRDNLNYGILLRTCAGEPPIPDFAAAGNQFFTNGPAEGDPSDYEVSECQ